MDEKKMSGFLSPISLGCLSRSCFPCRKREVYAHACPPNGHANTTGNADRRAMNLGRSISFKHKVLGEVKSRASRIALEFPPLMCVGWFYLSNPPPPHSHAQLCVAGLKTANHKKLFAAVVNGFLYINLSHSISSNAVCSLAALHCFSSIHRILLHPAPDLIKDGSKD